VFSSSLGVVSAIYLLKKDDQEKLSEIRGSMGIISIISANPLMGIGVVFCTAYAYVVKKKALDKNALTLGVGLAGTSMLMFSTLGFPLLMNLVIVIVVNKLIRKTYLQKNEIYEYLKAKIKIQKPVKFQNFQKLVEG
jgi:hypothetical protein